MRRLGRCQSLADAHLLAGLLGQAGVEALIFNANARAIAGELPLEETCPEVWVADPGDLPRARQILAEFEAPCPARPDIACRTCAEMCPDNFQVCWHCGAAL